MPHQQQEEDHFWPAEGLKQGGGGPWVPREPMVLHDYDDAGIRPALGPIAAALGAGAAQEGLCDLIHTFPGPSAVLSLL
eukprot:scaffold254529_cov24-Prasinocladus_malaysianus.AAC.1